jgi:hypothetical protein
MKTKIKDALKKDQNNKESASILQNKQSEIEKGLVTKKLNDRMKLKLMKTLLMN